jgi:three-Cys-motif partner protein
LDAPVVPILGPAAETVQRIIARLEPAGLHFAFIDPFSLGAPDFEIFRTLARRKRMDILVHLSKMDLQGNLDENLSAKVSAFNVFAPGWRSTIDIDQAQRGIRNEIVNHWRDLISHLGMDASTEMKLLKGSQNQHLYWLLLLANHQLAHQFWKHAANPERQGSLL